MFEVRVEERFSSGHALRGYKGKCENVHGHNYRVRVSLAGPKLNDIGLLVDFAELKRVLRGIIAGIDHQFLNDLDAVERSDPSDQHMAKYVYERMRCGLSELPGGTGTAEVIV